MRVTVIGFMGSGKSTVAALLAGLLGVRLIELDDLALKLSGRASIPEIFAEDGEEKFRDFESAALRMLCAEERAVVSSGGGVVMRPENRKLICAAGGRTVYLETGFDEIKRRLKGSSGRPLFQDLEKARALYELRAPLYRKFAELTVATDGKMPQEVAAEIKNRLGGVH